MRRAIVTFIENKYSLKLQVSGLYMSLKFIQDFDTDLIVFGPPIALSQLRCNCIKVPYNVNSDMNCKDYPFLYSLSCINSSNAALLDDYDYLLRSDVDTFITPKWLNFQPTDYVFGNGYYANNYEVKEHLLLTADKLGLTHRGFHNIGSTHYGTPKQIKEVHRLATEISDYLLHNDFATNTGKWPGWYRGVTTLYASELAVNHLITDFKKEGNDLDFPSISKESTSEHTHIHCWHTDQFFSKFNFERGDYGKLNFNSVPNTINNYCLYMARLGKTSLTYGREDIF